MALRDLFIKPDEEAQNSAQVIPQEQPIQVQNVAQVNTNNSAIPKTNTATASNTAIDNNIVSKIWETIIAKNLPGPDYIEFKNTAAGLASVIPDESLRYIGAFNVIKQSYPTFTKDIIINSIAEYISIVEKEKETGINECNNVRKAQIGDRQIEVEQLTETVKEIDRQIEELRNKRVEIDKKIVDLSSEINKSLSDINEREKIFTNSVENVISTLNSDKEKVSNLTI